MQVAPRSGGRESFFSTRAKPVEAAWHTKRLPTPSGLASPRFLLASLPLGFASFGLRFLSASLKLAASSHCARVASFACLLSQESPKESDLTPMHGARDTDTIDNGGGWEIQWQITNYILFGPFPSAQGCQLGFADS
jgi:hypothetical protein